MQTDDARNKAIELGHWLIPLLLAGTALIVMIMGDGAAEMLRYQRMLILEGEVWRMLSGHMVHLGWYHLVLNLVGLLLIWALTGDTFTDSAWWLLIFLCALSVALGLLLFNPELHWYVGLSGILHGLLLAGLVARLQTEGGSYVLLLLVVLVLKLTWEQLFGAMPGSESGIGGTVVVDAHLYGALGGAAGAVVLLSLPRWRMRFLRCHQAQGTSQQTAEP